MSHLWDTRAQPSAEGGSWFQHPEDALLTLAHHVPPLPESPSPAPQAPWPNWNNRPCSGCLCFPHSHLSSPLVSLQSCFQRSEELAPLLATILPILPKPHSYPDGWYPGFQSPDLPLCDHPPPQPICPLAAKRTFLRPTAPGSTLLRFLLLSRKKSGCPGVHEILPITHSSLKPLLPCDPKSHI